MASNYAVPMTPTHARWLVGAIGAVACAGHALGIATAPELPRDMNLAWQQVPAMYAQLAAGEWGRFGALAVGPGGWIQAAMAAWLRLVGPGPAAFSAPAIGWVGLTIVSVAGMAWAWGGPRAGVAAAATVAQLPAIVMVARTGWVHTPEAALMALAGWAHAADPKLTRARTLAALAIAGALTIMLRPSGLVWVAVLAVVVRSWKPLPFWAIAALPTLPVLRQYVGGKVGVRERYAETVEGLAHQLFFHLGPLGCVLVALAVVLAIRGRVRPPLLLGLWAGVALGLWAAFGAGLDNFPLLYVAIAAFVGLALARWPWLAVAGWVVFAGVTAAHDLEPKTRHADTVARLLAEACPGPCLVVAEPSLFAPHAEEPGRLELFLLGRTDVRVARPPEVRGERPVAMATWSCFGQPPRGNRFGLAETFRADVEGCTFVWSTR